MAAGELLIARGDHGWYDLRGIVPYQRRLLCRRRDDFASQYNSGSLHVLADGGVYAYGAAGSFPTQVWNASNYWVDIVLSPSGSPSMATTATANQSVSVLTAVAPSTDASSQLVNGAGAIQPGDFAISGQGSASTTAKLQGKSFSAQ